MEKIDCRSNPHSIKCKLFGPNKFGLVRENNDDRPENEDKLVIKKPTGLVKLKQFLTSPSPRQRPLKSRKKGKELVDGVDPDTGHGPSETPLAPLISLAPEQGPLTMCGVGAADCQPADHHLIPHTIKTISPAEDCATDNNTAW